MTRIPASPTPATARVPFGTRAVRRVLGIDLADLLAAHHPADPVTTALARQVTSAALRVDQLDAQIARDAAHLARGMASLGDDEDAHLQFSWGYLAATLQHLAADRRCLDMWHEALNAAMHTYTQARAATSATTTATGGHDAEAADPDPA